MDGALLTSVRALAFLALAAFPLPATAVQFDLPAPGQALPTILTSLDADRAGHVLTLDGAIARMHPYVGDPSQFWTLTATSAGYYRLQLYESGRLFSLSASQPGGPLAIEPSARALHQLWYVEAASGGDIVLRSAAFPFHAATGIAGGPVRLMPLDWSPPQRWIQFSAPPPPLPQPIVRMTSYRYQPAVALSPVEAPLVNTHRDPLIVVVTDLRNGKQEHLEIPPGQQASIVLERDAGGQIVESYEVVLDGQVVDSQEFVTSVPPRLLYDVSVYELFLQSIAIDRTGKSPSRIEDINYQPRSIGVFPIPPGARYDGEPLEVFELAREAANPGAVRRFRVDRGPIPRDADPLRRVLDQQLRIQALERAE